MKDWRAAFRKWCWNDKRFSRKNGGSTMKDQKRSEDYGYARVSTKGQNEARQIKEFEKQGIKNENIYIDKCSGRNFNRHAYRKLVGQLIAGDTLYIPNIDRLGRKYKEILNEWYRLTRDKDVKIIVLDTPILNTKNGDNTLLGCFIRDIVLLILAFQAEQEYLNIKERQKAGIAIAKENGKHLGRPKKVHSEEVMRTVSDWITGLLTIDEAMQEIGFKKTTIYELAKELKNI